MPGSYFLIFTVSPADCATASYAARVLLSLCNSRKVKIKIIIVGKDYGFYFVLVYNIKLNSIGSIRHVLFALHYCIRVTLSSGRALSFNCIPEQQGRNFHLAYAHGCFGIGQRGNHLAAGCPPAEIQMQFTGDMQKVYSGYNRPTVFPYIYFTEVFL